MKKKTLNVYKNKLIKMRNKYLSRVNRQLNYQQSKRETDRASLEQYIYSSSYFRAEAKKMLVEIDHALEKISNGMYGLCEKTGNYIDPNRLAAVPYTRYCNKGDWNEQ